MISLTNAWELIRNNAIKAQKTEIIWESLVEHKKYKIINVDEDSITIERESPHKIQKLTERKVLKAIDSFNNQNCYVKRRTLISPTVAEETALVLFHPNLGWDEKNEFIIKQ